MNRATLAPGPDSEDLALQQTVESGDGHLDFLAIRRKVAASLFPGSAQPMAFGRFKVLNRIGSGAMGSVYAAWDPELERRVAIKVVGWRAPTMDRMKREAKALARLSHPNVITVHEVGSVGEQVFVAMEYVKGRTLSEASRDVEWRAIVDLYLQAGEGLAAAHAAGLVHRDFKPDNAMVGDDGRVRVLDFGLARPLEGVDRETEIDGVPLANVPIDELTRTGSVIGTPAYMAPEQLNGSPADARSDQFSWCVSLCEALTGIRPWSADTLSELSDAVRNDAPKIDLPSYMPPGLKAVLTRGLRVERDERWADIDALLRATKAALQPRRVSRKLLVGTWAFLVVGVLGIALATNDETDDCRDPADAAAEFWGPSAAERVANLEVPDRRAKKFAEDLDEWTSRWKNAYASACGAAGSDRTKARACVDDLAVQAGGLVEAFEAEPLFPNAERRFDWPLADPGLCTPGQPGTGLPPVPPAAATDVAAVRLAIDNEMHRLSFHLYEGMEPVGDRMERARLANYPPVVAEAVFADAVRARYANDHAETERLSKEALETAQRAEHGLIIAKARLLLAEVAADVGRDDRTLAALVEEAERSIEQLPTERRAEVAALRHALASIVNGTRSEALAELGLRNFKLALDAMPAGHPTTVEALEDLGDHLEAMGRTEEALVEHLRAVEIWRAMLEDAETPKKRRGARNRLAIALARTHQFEEAIAVLRRISDDEPREALDETVDEAWIGYWYLQLGRPDEAEAAYRRVLELREPEYTVGAGLGLARVALIRNDLAAMEARLAASATDELDSSGSTLLVWVRILLGDANGADKASRAALNAQLKRMDKTDEALLGEVDARAAALIANSREAEAIELLDHDYNLERDEGGTSHRLLALALERLGRDHARAAELRKASESLAAELESVAMMDYVLLQEFRLKQRAVETLSPKR